MTKRAELADGTILEFPDDAPDQVIDSAVRNYIGAPVTASVHPSGPADMLGANELAPPPPFVAPQLLPTGPSNMVGDAEVAPPVPTAPSTPVPSYLDDMGRGVMGLYTDLSLIPYGMEHGARSLVGDAPVDSVLSRFGIDPTAHLTKAVQTLGDLPQNPVAAEAGAAYEKASVSPDVVPTADSRGNMQMGTVGDLLPDVPAIARGLMAAGKVIGNDPSVIPHILAEQIPSLPLAFLGGKAAEAGAAPLVRGVAEKVAASGAKKAATAIERVAPQSAFGAGMNATGTALGAGANIAAVDAEGQSDLASSVEMGLKQTAGQIPGSLAAGAALPFQPVKGARAPLNVAGNAGVQAVVQGGGEVASTAGGNAAIDRETTPAEFFAAALSGAIGAPIDMAAGALHMANRFREKVKAQKAAGVDYATSEDFKGFSSAPEDAAATGFAAGADGIYANADGQPVAFDDHKAAAKWATKNNLAGDFDLDTANDPANPGSFKIVLRRREGASPVSPTPEQPTGDAQRPADAGNAPVPAVVPQDPAPAPVSLQTPAEAPPVARPQPDDGRSQTPALPAPKAEPKPLGDGEKYVTTPAGDKVATRFEVVDASKLTPATGDLQNRDRSRASTDIQVQDIISKFDPTRLGDSAESDRGAPIVGPDGVIESGNGRMMALNGVYDGHPEKAQAYRDFIASQGHDITGIARPVLVRRRVTEMTPEQRVKFVSDSNLDTKLQMGASEKARTDAKLITPDTLSLYRGGDVADSGNRDFVRTMLGKLPAQEQAAFFASDGALSADGIRRVKSAMKAAAYGDAGLLETLDESTDSNIKSIGGALDASAAEWTRLRHDAEDGKMIKKFDITKQLVEAAKITRDLRNKGENVSDYLSQADAFNPHDPVTDELIKIFHNAKLTRGASKEAIASALSQYTKRARAQLTDPGMFGNDGPDTPIEALKAIIAERDGTDGRQGSMMAAEDAGIDDIEFGEGDTTLERPRKSVSDDTLEDRSGISDEVKGKYADTFLEASFTDRPSAYRSAVNSLGMDIDKFEILPAARKVELLKRALMDLTGIKVELSPRLQSQFAIDQLLDAHQTLQGMAEVLGISTRAIGLDGKLLLQFVKNARFLGSFMPGTNAITLPRRSNSFAHEWGHALDFHLLKKVSDLPAAGLTALVRSEGADFTPANVAEAFVKLLNAMFFDEAAMVRKIMDIELRIQSASTAKQKAALQAQIDNYLSGRSKAPEKSRYWQGANETNKAGGGGDYWTKPTEMFARAFEAYISHMADMAGYGTEFIGKGDVNYRSDAEARFQKTFPKGEERDAIFNAIGELMVQLHNEAMIDGDGTAAKYVEGDLRKMTDFDRHVETLPNGSLLKREMDALQRRARQKARAAEGRSADPKTKMQRTKDAASPIFLSMSGSLKMLEARWKSKAIKEIHDHLAWTPGVGEGVKSTFVEAVTMTRNRSLNRLSNILKAAKLEDMDDKQERALRDVLLGDDTGASANMVKAAAGIRSLLNDEFYRNQNAGIDIGYVRENGYMPRMLDLPKVFNNEAGFTDKAAKVYEVVFDKEIGDSPEAILSDDEALPKFLKIAGFHKIPGVKEIRTLIKQINSLNRQISKSDDPDVLEGKVAKLSEDLLESIGDIFNDVRAAWAKDKAEAWLLKIRTADFEFDAHSPDTQYTKERSLPMEADKLLEDFYIHNPVEAVVNYIGQSSRRTAYAERFGAKGEKLKKLVDQMTEEGVPAEDQQEVLRVVAIATGRVGRGVSKSVQMGLSMVQTYGTIRLLGRAVLSSLVEPITAGIAAGDFTMGIRHLAATMVGVRSMDGKQRRELARAIGLVTDLTSDNLMEERFGGTYADSPRISALAAAMFRNTGLVALTRAQRTHVIAPAQAYLENISRHALSKKGDVNAEALLSELGIQDPKVFAKQLLENGGLPTLEDLDTDFGRDWALAMKRFADMTIQEPNPMLRPQLANHPVGQIIYGIMSFSMSFWNRVTKRQILLMREMYKRKGAGSVARHAAFALAPAAFALFAAQAVTSTMREFLLNHDRWEKLKEDGELEKNLISLAFQRSFSFGLADPAINAYSGLRYQRDLSNMMVGPAPGVILQGMQTIITSTQRNSKKNNTSEYNRTKAIYDMIVGPAIATALSLAPGGPLTAPLAGVGQALATSPASGHAVAKMIHGEKGSKTDPNGNLMPPKRAVKSGGRENPRKKSD